MQRVLFLCTGNSARIQMAEAFLRKYAGEYFETDCAGLEPKDVNSFTIRGLQEKGIDISGQSSRGWILTWGKRYSNISSPYAMIPKRNAPPFGRV